MIRLLVQEKLYTETKHKICNESYKIFMCLSSVALALSLIRPVITAIIVILDCLEQNKIPFGKRKQFRATKAPQPIIYGKP